MFVLYEFLNFTDPSNNFNWLTLPEYPRNENRQNAILVQFAISPLF